MNNTQIISVGSELTSGSILNTNAQYLAKKLTEFGFNVTAITTVPDSYKSLKSFFKEALKTSDVIILTGGLGPTADDMTKECVSEVLGLKLVLNTYWKEHIIDYFNKRGFEITENNLKQAYLPEGSILLDNPRGTASGIYITSENTKIFLLPGVPGEMKEIFSKEVLPILEDSPREKKHVLNYKITGLGESKVEDMIKDLVAQQDNENSIATYASPGEILLRLSTVRERPDWEEIIEERLGQYVFSREDEKLYEAVSKFLIENDITISTAESCTGGLISEMLTRVSGISSVFLVGIVSYSNEAKMKLLDVKRETLEKFGAVSEETCREMCENVRAILDSDIGIAVTGIAGPEGGSEEKPVGLVYTGVSTKDKTVIKENHFAGNRETVRERSANTVFGMIREIFIKR